MEKYKEQFIKATSPLFLTPKCQFDRTFPNTNPRLQDRIQDFPFRELGYNPTYQAPNGLAFMVFCFWFGRISFVFNSSHIKVSFVFLNGMVVWATPRTGQGAVGSHCYLLSQWSPRDGLGIPNRDFQRQITTHTVHPEPRALPHCVSP